MLELTPLPALADNYIWAFGRRDEAPRVVVDPGDARPVLRHLAAQRLRLTAILLTHHHADHVAGAAALAEATGAPVFGPPDARLPIAPHAVRDGDSIELPELGLEARVLHVPGHTLSHVAYVVGPALFAGDTLFSVGCGRLFEGSPAEMLASLDRLAALDPALLLCAGHEYTEANCRFALGLEPDNAVLRAKSDAVTRLRAAGRPSLPTTLAGELACNPFLRVRNAGLRGALARAAALPRDTDDVTAFAALRRLKDQFRG